MAGLRRADPMMGRAPRIGTARPAFQPRLFGIPMTLDELKDAVLEANLATIRHGLVIATFGNASGVHRESDRIVIKPSGVPYERLQAEDMVLTDLDGVPL